MNKREVLTRIWWHPSFSIPPQMAALLSALLKNAFKTIHCSSTTIQNQMSLCSWLQLILWHGPARFPSWTCSCIAINRPGVKLQLWLELDFTEMAISFISVLLLFFHIFPSSKKVMFLSISSTMEKLLAGFLWNLVEGCSLGQGRTHSILERIHKLFFIFINI